MNGPGGWEPLSMTEPGTVGSIDSFDHNDKNWWCPLEPDRDLLALRSEFDAVTGNATTEWDKEEIAAVVDTARKPMLDQAREKSLKVNPAVRDIGWKEIGALTNMPSAPKRLTERAIAWGKRSKGDDGAPEALALAVRTTRYGCNWHGGHGAYSKAAHDLLKAKFGGTDLGFRDPVLVRLHGFGMDQRWN